MARALLSFPPSHYCLHCCFTLFGHTCARPKSISTGAHYVTLDNKIKCLSKADFVFWATPPIKTGTGTANKWELLTNSKPPGPIRNTELQYCLIYYSFLDVHNCVATFTSHGKLHEFGAEKPIS